MKFLVYTKNETRKNLLISVLKDVRAHSSLQFEFITELNVLGATLVLQEYSVIGGIIDFDQEDYKTLDIFISKIANLHSKVNILTCSPYKLTELDYFTIKKVSSFEEVLLEASNFAFKCESLPYYSYKLVVEKRASYLEEYFAGEKTKTKKICVTDYKDGTLNLYIQNIDALVIKRMFNPYSNLSNIFEEIRMINVTSKGRTFPFFQRYTVKEIEEFIKS